MRSCRREEGASPTVGALGVAFPLLLLVCLGDFLPPHPGFLRCTSKKIYYFLTTRAHPSLVVVLKILCAPVTLGYFHYFLCILFDRSLLPPLVAFLHCHVSNVETPRALWFAMSGFSTAIAHVWGLHLPFSRIDIHGNRVLRDAHWWRRVNPWWSCVRRMRHWKTAEN